MVAFAAFAANICLVVWTLSRLRGMTPWVGMGRGQHSGAAPTGAAHRKLTRSTWASRRRGK